MNYITLHQLADRISSALQAEFHSALWLQTEISELRVSGGHCYMEFIEKATDSNVIAAKCRAQIWAGKWNVIRPYFEQATGQPLSAGMQVLVRVEVKYHDIYGLSLSVVDIDPTYTIGDIARRRQEIIQRLKEEGIANMNRELPLPRLLQRIAVISSASAAGWGDFHNQLLENQYGLRFHVQLFEAVMQGEKVEPSVIQALDAIAAEADRWDAVVIIRGGGAISDLAGFDSLLLAECVAQFPLPVITGIGHERDDTVIDLIAHTRVKTPTAAAEMILAHQLRELEYVMNLADRLKTGTSTYFLQSLSHIEKKESELRLLSERLLQSHLHKLELMEQKISDANPDRLMRLGFSIVRHNDHAVKDASTLHPGNILDITFAEGSAYAVVN